MACKEATERGARKTKARSHGYATRPRMHCAPPFRWSHVTAGEYGHVREQDTILQRLLVVRVGVRNGLAGLAKHGLEVRPQRCSRGLDRAERCRLCVQRRKGRPMAAGRLLGEHFMNGVGVSAGMVGDVEARSRTGDRTVTLEGGDGGTQGAGTGEILQLAVGDPVAGGREVAEDPHEQIASIRLVGYKEEGARGPSMHRQRWPAQPTNPPSSCSQIAHRQRRAPAQ